MEEQKQIGTVFSYFSNASVAAIELSGNLKVGDKVKIKGATTDTETTIEDIQIHKESVKEAKAGDKIGIKVSDKVRPNNKVYLVG